MLPRCSNVAVCRASAVTRLSWLIGPGCALVLFSGLTRADSSASHDFQIAPQALASALVEFSKQADVQVLGATESIQTLRTAGVVGHLTEEQALQRLLQGTELDFRWTGHRTLTIGPHVAPAPAASSDAAYDDGSIRSAQANSIQDTSQAASISQESPPQASGGLSSNRSEAANPNLTEIIVTAQKRNERLQDVPVPVTVLSADALLNNNQLRLQDYFSSIPGLSLTSTGHGDATLSIRGLTTGGYTNPTVGVTVDDVPIQSTTILGNRTGAPDFDPSDLAQIELLRGPQGTLYGANSIGGLLKYVTADPSVDALSGRVQVDGDHIQNGEGEGYGVRGSVNLPISDTVAVRASAFVRHDPGYIDDPAHHLEGVNALDVEGARLASIWHISPDWSLKLSALWQKTSAEGGSEVTLGTGDLNQVALPGTGGFDHQLSAYSASVSGNVSGLHIAAITGYSIDKFDGNTDLSRIFGSPTNQPNYNKTAKFSEELRLSGTITPKVDWLVGGFYTYENTPTRDLYQSLDPTTYAVTGLLIDDSYPTTYAEFAGFADLTVHFTDQFDIQIGGRESKNRQTYEETLSGEFYPVTTINPTEHTSDNSFTYLVTPRYRISSTLMTYARIASGYRPGGPNNSCTLYPIPCRYEPDKTRNFELGVKGEALDKELSFDASIYYVDWKDIQLQAFAYYPNGAIASTYLTNGGTAKSQGIELSAELRPMQGLSLSGWISLNDAKLTQNLPPTSTAAGLDGDRLPYASRFSGNLAAQQNFKITDFLTAFVSGSVNYLGDRKDVFVPASIERATLPGYAQINARSGIQYNAWTVSLFANNLADRRGSVNTDPLVYNSITYIQPRTLGISLVKIF
jgi:iron complex outermembrane recepter protein